MRTSQSRVGQTRADGQTGYRTGPTLRYVLHSTALQVQYIAVPYTVGIDIIAVVAVVIDPCGRPAGA